MEYRDCAFHEGKYRSYRWCVAPGTWDGWNYCDECVEDDKNVNYKGNSTDVTTYKDDDVSKYVTKPTVQDGDEGLAAGSDFSDDECNDCDVDVTTNHYDATTGTFNDVITSSYDTITNDGSFYDLTTTNTATLNDVITTTSKHDDLIILTSRPNMSNTDDTTTPNAFSIETISDTATLDDDKSNSNEAARPSSHPNISDAFDDVTNYPHKNVNISAIKNGTELKKINESFDVPKKSNSSTLRPKSTKSFTTNKTETTNQITKGYLS